MKDVTWKSSTQRLPQDLDDAVFSIRSGYTRDIKRFVDVVVDPLHTPIWRTQPLHRKLEPFDFELFVDWLKQVY